MQVLWYQKTCYNGAVLEIVRCKGYRTNNKKEDDGDEEEELTFEHFINGKVITQKQLQFSIPKSNLLSETNKYSVSKKIVPKIFKPTYSKGIIDKETGKVDAFYN